MIVALAGRKQSGKTLLADIAVKNGFKKLSFADPLKNIVSKLLGVPKDQISNLKKAKINFSFSNESISLLADEIGVDPKIIEHFCVGKQIKTGRDLLQFIGSDLIRRIDEDWHIKKIKNLILDSENYICDDLRFKNEKAFLDEKGTISFFVIRPRQFEFDHHESEVSLRWHDFNDWIINNLKSSKSITKRFDDFTKTLNRGYVSLEKGRGKHKVLDFRKQIKEEFENFGPNYIKEKYAWSIDSVNLWIYKLMIYRTREIFNFEKKSFSEPNEQAAYLAGVLSADGCIKDNSRNCNITLSLGMMDKEPVQRLKEFLKTDRPIFSRPHNFSKRMVYTMDTNNPFILENLKLWNIKPRKSEKEEVPWIIKDDINLLKPWMVGLIDGDGTIVLGKSEKCKNTSLIVSFLCSEEIKDFLLKTIPLPFKFSKHKNTKLFDVKIYNHHAVDFYNWLGEPSYGLERKWGRILQFKKQNTTRRTPKNEFSN